MLNELWVSILFLFASVFTAWIIPFVIKKLDPKIRKNIPKLLIVYTLLFAGFHLVNCFMSNGLLFAIGVAFFGKDMVHFEIGKSLKLHYKFQQILSGTSLVFLGIAFTPSIFTDRWLMILVALVSYFGLKFLLSFYVKTKICKDITKKEYVLGAVHRASAIVLAISIPLTYAGWYTVQAMILGVVLIEYLLIAPLLIFRVNRK